jgi:hypothetical protein
MMLANRPWKSFQRDRNKIVQAKAKNVNEQSLTNRKSSAYLCAERTCTPAHEIPEYYNTLQQGRFEILDFL